MITPTSTNPDVTRGNGFVFRTCFTDECQGRALAALAPERLCLPSGRQLAIHYEAGREPWAASRLQDFFGLRDTPRIARGQVSLVVHLLAPSQGVVEAHERRAGWVPGKQTSFP